jgi:hypothetical protein
MGFGSKSSTPAPSNQPIITQAAPTSAGTSTTINRAAGTAEAQDRVNTNSSGSNLLGSSTGASNDTSMLSDDDMRKRAAGASTLG